jgi:hypothetical protein
MANRFRPALVVLGVVAGLVPAPVPVRLRCAVLIFGIYLGLFGTWILIPALLAPEPNGLSLDRILADAASTRRPRAVLAARIGAIRGDLWAEAAFTGAHFTWQDPATVLDETASSQLNSVRANAETALVWAPVNSAVWLLLAMLTQNPSDRDSPVSTFLEMSYFTAPNDLSLGSLRVMRAATSSAVANKDIQLFLKSDIRGLLDREPDHQQDIIDAYRQAWPQNQPIFENLVAEINPAVALLLSSPQKSK